MRVPTARSAVILVLVLALAGCGGSGGAGDSATSTDPAAEATDSAETAAVEPTEDTSGSSGGGSGFGAKPCDLLAQQAVEAATGASGMTPTAVPTDAASGLCGYRAADGAEVVLSVWEGDAGTAMWTTMDMIVSAGGVGIERIDGLGADAIWSSGDGTLVLAKNGTTVQVAVRLPDKSPDDVRPIADDLARQIAARL
jgi:hypothetical protein